MTKKLDFLIHHMPRTGSTWLSKLLTENSQACVLPETNFLFYILNEKKKLKYEDLLKFDNKFLDLGIDKIKISSILKNKNRHKVIDQICSLSAKKIYKKSNLYIGLKKTALNHTINIINSKKVKIIFLIRDIRDIYLSNLQANKIRNKFKTSILRNIYDWNIECIFFENMKKKDFIKVKYEDLIINNKKEIEKILKFLSLKFIKKNKSYHLPQKYKNIHKNLEINNLSNNSKKYIDKLSFIKNFIIIIFCYHYLLKLNYIKKNYFYEIINCPIYLIFKFLFFLRLYK